MKKKRSAAICAGLVAAAAIGYSVYWHIAAGKVDESIDFWVGNQRRAGLTLAFTRTPISGFPFAFRTVFHDPHVNGAINGQTIDWRGPDLELSLSPIDFETIRFSAPGRHVIDLGGGSYGLDAAALHGEVVVRGDGTLAEVSAELGASKLSAPDGRAVAVASAQLGAKVPPTPPKTDQYPAVEFSASAKDLTLPSGVRILTADPLPVVQIAGTVKGPVPIAPLRQALAAWRDRGGTLEIASFTVAQPPLSISGSATLALDPDLQPIGAANMTAQGLGPTLDLLARQGRIAAGDAARFKLFVMGAERAGAGGVKEVATGLSLQGGYLSWGPIRVARVPRIAWR